MFSNKDAVRHLYYNVGAVNKSDNVITLNYNDTRSESLLENLDDYTLSILRFQIDMSDVPLIVFPTNEFETFQRPPYNTIDNNYWSITIEEGGTARQDHLEYITYGHQAPYIYNIQHFIDILNIALKTASDALALGTDVPYFSYNKATSSIDLYAPASYRFSSVDRKLYVNKNLYDDFAREFPGIIRNLDSGRYYEILITPQGNNSITTEITDAGALEVNRNATAGYRISTYFPNLGTLIAPRSLVFTTSRLPVISEYLSDNLDLDNDSSFNFQRVLKDFEISLEGSDAVLSRGIQNFSINSEFEKIQFKGAGESLRNIDIQVFWKDKHGRLNPFPFSPGSNFNMKLYFERK